jgi:hypothetical protein
VAADNWLSEEFERARADYESLPEWARPVYVPPIAEPEWYDGRCCSPEQFKGAAHPDCPGVTRAS